MNDDNPYASFGEIDAPKSGGWTLWHWIFVDLFGVAANIFSIIALPPYVPRWPVFLGLALSSFAFWCHIGRGLSKFANNLVRLEALLRELDAELEKRKAKGKIP